jgi:site-specific DNA recombinase
VEASGFDVSHAEADIVRTIYDKYVGAAMSIGAITRLLTERGVPTRKQISRWERTTVWAILRNPAYKGTACFGKTETAPRQRITRRNVSTTLIHPGSSFRLGTAGLGSVS